MTRSLLSRRSLGRRRSRGDARGAARRLAGVAVLAVVAVPASTGAPVAAAATDLCVGPRPGCVRALQTAVDRAAPGSTIRIDRGTYAGGVSVTESVTIVGSGAGETVLRGGGPVITIGSFGDPTPPTVQLRDLTISGGRTTTSAVSRAVFDQDGVFALGGGVEIPPGAPTEDGLPGVGATVTLTRTTVANNRAAPTAPVPSGLPCPGHEDCPFALAAGGGIDSWGDLRLVDSVVRGNRVGRAPGLPVLASDAEGGGIRSWVGTLTLLRSRVHRNAAVGMAPNGRFAEGGGVFHGAGFFPAGGRFTLRDSRVTENRAWLAAGLPDDVGGTSIDMVAIGGGLQLTSEVPRTSIGHSVVAGNSVRMTNSVGSAVAFAGGVLTNVPTPSRIVHSTIRDNRSSAATIGVSTGLAHADTGGLQLHGDLVRSSVRGNWVRARSRAGDAEAWAGAVWGLLGRVLHTSVHSNRVAGVASEGAASVRGAGLVVDKAPEADRGGLVVRRSRVVGNSGAGAGDVVVGRGGGIFDARVSALGPFGGPLALIESRVEGNRLRPKSAASGGGLYLRDQRLVLRGSRIRFNDPDDCVGCRSGAAGRFLPTGAADGPSRAALVAAKGVARLSLSTRLRDH